jgi:predicted dehydrogenase
MGKEDGKEITRRDFVRQAGGALLAASSAGMTARSYARVLGANDRIRIAQLGCGGRSGGHVQMVYMASKQTPVETIAVCDIWNKARERCAEQVKRLFNNDPKSYQYSEQMLENKDIDGVMIATGDFQHAKLCTEVVRAGKDCYVEKPFANVLSEAKEARDTVKASKQVVQMGSQHRSEPYNLAVREFIRSGRIGKVVHIEQEWNVNQERWRYVGYDAGRDPGLKADYEAMRMGGQQDWSAARASELKEEDTDWKRWLLGKPYRPFNPHVYLEFRLYKDFSGGIFDQWLSHGSDLVHLWTEESYPVSATAEGGVFVWKDGRENPDHCVAALTYPQGFLYTYKTLFGNSYRSFSRINGTNGTIINYGGEGASLFVVTKEGGMDNDIHWQQSMRQMYGGYGGEGGGQGGRGGAQGQPASAQANQQRAAAREAFLKSVGGWTPMYYTTLSEMGTPSEEAEIVKVEGAGTPNSVGGGDNVVIHLMNWLNAVRDRRPPNATVDHGYSHALVCIMAQQAYWSGKKLYYDPKAEEIVDHPVVPDPA